MVILVINTGSSSIKYQLIDMVRESTVLRGIIERIGGDSVVTYTAENSHTQTKNISLTNHYAAFSYLTALLSNREKICAIGHRVAHGGKHYTSPTLITDEVISNIDALAEFAPLHNKANLLGIHACIEVFGTGIPQVAIFDTAFHKDIPRYAYLYPIPYRYYTDYGIRRFGFHGISHRYASERCAQLMGRSDLRIITCHLGNGCSIAAVKNGVSIDTSMGLTPNEGIMMGTRCGSIDPTIISYIAKCERITYEEALNISNRESGLLGISGQSNDYRDLVQYNNDQAGLALQMQKYQIMKAIGSYLAILSGADAIVFTGGIGEHVPELRKYVCEHLNFAGIILDNDANISADADKRISAADSKVEVYVIPANEELIIARDTLSVLEMNNTKQ